MVIHTKPSPDLYILHNAVAHADLDAVAAILNSQPELISQRNENGLTPLHVSVMTNDWPVSEDMVNLLLYNGARINGSTAEGRDTPLHLMIAYAKLYNTERTITTLLRNGAYVDVLNDNMRTPVDLALANGYHELVRLMEKSQDDPETLNRWDEEMEKRDRDRKLFHNSQNNNKKSKPQSDQQQQQTPPPRRKAPVKRKQDDGENDEEEEEQNGPKFSANNEELIRATIAGNSAIIKKLLSDGADPNYVSMLGYSPVHYAVAKKLRNTTAILDILKENGADLKALTAENDSLLTLAIKKQPSEESLIPIVKYLLNNGIDKKTVDQDGRDALVLAQDSELHEVVKLLSDQPPRQQTTGRQNKVSDDPNYIAGDYHNVHKLCTDKDKPFQEVKKELENHFKKGTRIDIRSKKNNETCLHLATKEGNLQLVEYLLSKDATVNVTNALKETPVYISQEVTPNKQIEEILIKKQNAQAANRKLKAAAITAQAANRKRCTIL